jgi:predicted RNA-binding protein with PIN domain
MYMDFSMRYLIDGYNLLYRLGLMRARMGPGELAGARQRLVSLLMRASGKDAGQICIVFDSAAASAKRAPDRTDQGIDIRFAGRGEAADDLIEDLIRGHSAPKQLSVISDDRRLQRAARRRACRVVGCAAYLEDIENKLRPHFPHRKADPARAALPVDDRDFWIRTFDSMEEEPELREFFDLDRFEDTGKDGRNTPSDPARAKRQL